MSDLKPCPLNEIRIFLSCAESIALSTCPNRKTDTEDALRAKIDQLETDEQTYRLDRAWAESQLKDTRIELESAKQRIAELEEEVNRKAISKGDADEQRS